jgi:hypothetical protein
MTQDRNLALEDRARLTEIQDLLLERVIERKEAIERGQDGRAKVLENDQRVQTGKGEHQEMDNGRIGLA